MVGRESETLVYRSIYWMLSTALGPIAIIPAVLFAPAYATLAAGLLTILVWRVPTSALVLLPVATLLIPEIPTQNEFQLSVNVALIVVFVSVLLTRYHRFVLPRQYLLALSGAFALSLIATTRSLFVVSGADVSQFLFLFQWTGYLALPLFGVILVQQISEETWTRLYRAVLLATGAASAVIVAHLLTVHFGILPAYAGGEEIERAVGQRRLRTIWTQGPNTTGMFLTIQALFGYAFAVSFDRLRVRAAAGGYALLTAVLMFFTFSRSALVALIVGVGVVTAVWKIRYLTAVGASLLVAIPLFPATFRRRFFPSDLFASQYIETLGYSLPVGPLARRLTLWGGFVDEFLTRPLLGSGFFWVAMDNTYVNLVVGTGLLGAGAHLVLFAVLLSLCYRCHRTFEGTDRLKSAVGLATLASLLAFLAWGVFSEVFARWRVLGLLSTVLILSVGAEYRGRLTEVTATTEQSSATEEPTA